MTGENEDTQSKFRKRHQGYLSVKGFQGRHVTSDLTCPVSTSFSEVGWGDQGVVLKRQTIKRPVGKAT